MTDSVSFRRPESVLVVVYTREQDVLLMQRVDAPEFWQSITGGLEHEELAKDAAIRELQEETGLLVSQLGTSIVDHQRSKLFEIGGMWRKRYSPEHTHNREHVFSLQLPAQVELQLDGREHSAFVWLPAIEAMERATSVTNRVAIGEIVLAKG